MIMIIGCHKFPFLLDPSPLLGSRPPLVAPRCHLCDVTAHFGSILQTFTTVAAVGPIPRFGTKKIFIAGETAEFRGIVDYRFQQFRDLSRG